MSMDLFRRGAQSVINQGRKGGGGKKGNYFLRYQLPKKPANSPYQVAQPIIFIDANYPDIYNIDAATGQPIMHPGFHFKTHQFRLGPKEFKEIICSGGVDGMQPCIGHAEAQSGRHKGADVRDKMAFNIAHLMPYHTNIPYVKDNQIQMKKDGSGPVTIEEPCELRGCKYCAQGLPMKFGQHRYFEVGTGHLQQIMQWADKIGAMCANCNTTVVPLQFDCERCNVMMLDVAKSGFNNQELADYARGTDPRTKQPVVCPNCRQTGTQKEIIDCGYDPQGYQKIGGCPDNVDPRRLSLFEVVIYAQKEGEGTDSTLVDVGFVRKEQFQTPDGRPLDVHLSEIVKSTFDFPAMFAPESLDDQAKRLRVSNPWAQQSYAPPAAAYGSQPQAPQGYPPAQPGVYGGQPAQQYPQQPSQYPQPNLYPQQPQYPQQQQPPAQPYPGVPGRPNFGR